MSAWPSIKFKAPNGVVRSRKGSKNRWTHGIMVWRDDIPNNWQLWCCAMSREEADEAAARLHEMRQTKVVVVEAIKKRGGYTHGKRKTEQEPPT